MKTCVDFGGTPEFKLLGAILLYQGHNTAFATYDPVREGRQEEAPQLGAAQPLTTAFLEQLAGDLGHRLPVEILPENVLVRTPEVLVWWSPARARTMFFAEHVEEAQAINGKRFPQPALVFKVAGRELWVRALPENHRPGPGMELDGSVLELRGVRRLLPGDDALAGGGHEPGRHGGLGKGLLPEPVHACLRCGAADQVSRRLPRALGQPGGFSRGLSGRVPHGRA